MRKLVHILAYLPYNNLKFTPQMKKVRFRLIALVIVSSSVWIFLVKGSEAKQKWVFKMKDKYENRRILAQQKLIKRQGGVLLDDIEMQAYHS